MEGHNTHPFLPALSPVQQSLSFCESTPKGVRRWLQTLPKANLGKMAKQVYHALLELNQLITTAENRLAMLELLRSEVFFITQQLESELLHHPLMLDKRAQQIAHLCQSLQEHLAGGYHQIVVEQAQVGNINRDPEILSLALQRTCHILRALLLRCCQLHQTPTNGLWLELHRLYQMGCKFGVQKMPHADAQSLPDEISLEQTWLSAVLLGCVRTNQLHQSSIAPLLAAFEIWGSRVKLQAAHAESSLFVVLLQHDQPPCYRFFLSDEESGGSIGIDPGGLVQVIQQLLRPAAARPAQLPEALTAALLQHLLNDFTAPPERRWERRPTQDKLTLCVGLRALHYFLSGERPFEPPLAQHTRNAALFAADEPSPQRDVWGGRIGSGENQADVSGNFDFTPGSLPTTDDEGSEQYPLYQEQLLNRSSGGYCLSWQARDDVQLSIGELVGIREADRQDWKIARVSWMMQEGESIQAGVEHIADNALPCALQRVRSGPFEQPFLRALLLPADNTAAPAQLIAPSLPFQQGDQVRIHTGEEERLALLEHCQGGSINFNQFAYRLLGEGGVGSSLWMENNATARDASIQESRFDALWDTL